MHMFDNLLTTRDDGMQPAAKLNELEIGKLKRVVLQGQSVLITLLLGTDGSLPVEVIAFSSICPHAMGDLSMGWITHDEIDCPLHYYRFKLRTGECASPRGGPHLRTYPTKIEGNTVLVKVDKPRWMES